MTLSEHIQASGKNPASVQRQWRRKQQAGLISRPFSRDLVPTDAELAVLFGQAPTSGQLDKKTVKVSENVQTDKQTVKQTVKPTRTRTNGQRAILVGIIIVCASVSVLQSGPIRKKEELNTAIKELCELDRIRIQRNGNSTVLKVNPALFGCC